MPFKRPAPPERDLSSGYSSRSESGTGQEPHPSKRRRTSGNTKILPHVKLYIVQAKIDGPALTELFHLAERHCQRLCEKVEDADVVLTSISMRRRFERHISWDVAVGCLSNPRISRPFTYMVSRALENKSYRNP